MPWAVVAAAGLGGWSLTHFAYSLDMATASALGTVVFVARRRAVVGLVVARRDLHRLALTDPLTGLRNRRGLEHGTTELLRTAGARPLDLLYLDLDGFKAVNDRRGHAEGDRVLVAVADVLRRTFRAQDVVGRIGGDEFVVVLAPSLPVDVAAARLRDGLAAWHEDARRLGVGVSLGTGRMAEQELDALWVAIDAADRQMYADKEERRQAASRVASEVAAAAATRAVPIGQAPGPADEAVLTTEAAVLTADEAVLAAAS